jgi:VanZ family protein
VVFIKKKKSMQKERELSVFFFVLCCACLVMIFRFSSQTSNQSNTLSGRLSGAVCDFLEKERLMPPGEKERYYQNINFFLRKCAHFTEYFLLGLCLSLFFHYRRRFFPRKTAAWVLLLSFLFACGDEIHQIFVSARTPAMRDVFIDTAGAFFAVLLLYALLKGRRNRKLAPDSPQTRFP